MVTGWPTTPKVQETGRARLRTLVVDGAVVLRAIGPCLRPSQGRSGRFPERSPRQMIAQSLRSGNTRRPGLARIVHGTPRDPQHALAATQSLRTQQYEPPNNLKVVIRELV